MKNICILGSTGSIGRNSLEVIANFSDRFRPVCLTANRDIQTLFQQVERYRPETVAILDPDSARQFKNRVNGSVRVLSGQDGLLEAATRSDVDIVIGSLVGFAGLRPTIEAIKMGKTVALANKETLVAAGELIMKLAREHHASIIPIDSEHSAILQCLAGESSASVRKLILTASGGPFLNLSRTQLANVLPQDALRHPTWKMGKKITIDSATMMNKGLEVLEAHWLFDLPADRIEVLIHPQSVVHSMVEFVDGSVKAQLGVPDMKIPIQYALTYPERSSSTWDRLDFSCLKELTFFKPDAKKFPCLDLAYGALRTGRSAPVVLNAANEVAVERFLSGSLTFDRIPALIERAMAGIPLRDLPTLEDIIAVDHETREYLATRQEEI